MNGYTMMSDNYRMLAEQGKIDKAVADKVCRIYDFLSTCDMDDLCKMVDSSAFNDIIRSYLRMALESAELDDLARDRVLNQLRWTFDKHCCRDILNKYS